MVSVLFILFFLLYIIVFILLFVCAQYYKVFLNTIGNPYSGNSLKYGKRKCLTMAHLTEYLPSVLIVSKYKDDASVEILQHKNIFIQLHVPGRHQ